MFNTEMLQELLKTFIYKLMTILATTKSRRPSLHKTFF